MSSEARPQPRNALLITLHIHQKISTNDECKKFREELEKLIGSFAYKSPEILTHSSSWIRLDYIMKKYIQNRDTAWKSDAIDIYTGAIVVE